MARTLLENWTQIPFDQLHLNITTIFISLLFLYFNFILSIFGWQKIITKFGQALNFRSAYWIMATSQISKYIPGGIWFTISRMQLADKKGLRSEVTAFSVIIETCLIFLTGIILMLISMITGAHLISLYLILPLLIISILFLYPPLLKIFADFMVKILKRPKVDLRLSFGDILMLSLFYFGVWISQIIGFFLLINSFYPVPVVNFPYIALTYISSWIGGFVVIYAPGGIGIREGIMSFLLSKILPVGLSVGFSVIARVWTIIYEVIVFATGQLLLKRGDKDQIH